MGMRGRRARPRRAPLRCSAPVSMVRSWMACRFASSSSSSKVSLLPIPRSFSNNAICPLAASRVTVNSVRQVSCPWKRPQTALMASSCSGRNPRCNPNPAAHGSAHIRHAPWSAPSPAKSSRWCAEPVGRSDSEICCHAAQRRFSHKLVSYRETVTRMNVAEIEVLPWPPLF